MKRFGLIGERLSHSYSKMLHELLADYSYDLWPMPPEALDGFLKSGGFDGMNVTIPYKQRVIPYLSEMGETARRIGSVNTIVKRADGTLFGDNTDAYGMREMARRAGIAFRGEKTLILGSGGTSLTARAVVEAEGGHAVVISRGGPNTYDALEQHADAAYLINTTPVGMYPNTGAAAVDLTRLPGLRGVLDVIYNPLRTRLLQQARALGIPCEGGLCMLVYQAVRACELFTGEPVAPEKARAAEEALRRQVTNLVLVGMPGSGKSTLGRLLAKRLGLPLCDLDDEIVKEAGMPIPDIFAREGEAGFRRREAELTERYGREGGRILVTGGGVVKESLNRENLRLNGFVVHVMRDTGALAMNGRPLSTGPERLKAMWQERAPLYAACADATISNNQQPGDCARAIEEAYHEALCN